MRVTSFYKCSKFDVYFRNGETLEKLFWVFDKNAFELISLNTHFYRKKLLVIRSQCVNKEKSLKISDTTKKEFGK